MNVLFFEITRHGAVKVRDVYLSLIFTCSLQLHIVPWPLMWYITLGMLIKSLEYDDEHYLIRTKACNDCALSICQKVRTLRTRLHITWWRGHELAHD